MSSKLGLVPRLSYTGVYTLVPKICTNGKFRALTALSAPSVHEKGGFWRETRERGDFCALTENSVH